MLYSAVLFDAILKCKPRKLMPQCIAVPENALQVENWHLFLDFLVNFWLSINIFIFGAFNHLFVKNQLI